MEEIFRDESFALAHHLDVTFSIVVDTNRMAHAAAFERQFRAFPNNPYIGIIGANATPPSNDIRGALMDAFDSGACPFAVMVFLQTGFRAALSRSVVTAMSRLGGIRFPVVTAKSTDGAVDLLEARFGPRPELKRSITEITGSFQNSERDVAR